MLMAPLMLNEIGCGEPEAVNVAGYYVGAAIFTEFALIAKGGRSSARARFSVHPDGVRWVQGGVLGDRRLRGQCRGCGQVFEVAPPFAPSYVHYTQRLSEYVYALSWRMTLVDVSDRTGLSWNTVNGKASASGLWAALSQGHVVSGRR